MKIQFFENQSQKRKIRKESTRFAALPDRLSVYRAGRDGFIDMRAAVSILMPVAHELEAAHAEMETMPALTPDNIRIVAQKLTISEEAKDYRGMIYPGYSAPEMYTGETLGVKTDIYAFSAILYFLVTGSAPENAFNRLQDEKPLFSEDLYLDILNAKSIYVPDLQLEEDPFELDIDAGEGMPVIPDNLIDKSFISILEKGMELDAEDRYSDMAEMIAALSPYDTKASIIYPVIVGVEQDEIHDNLIVTKTVRRKLKKEKPRAPLAPEERTRSFDEEREHRAREKDWTPGWEEAESPVTEMDKPGDAAERAASMEVVFASIPVSREDKEKAIKPQATEKMPRGKRAIKKELETADEAEQTAAERAASMEAVFASIPVSEEDKEKAIKPQAMEKKPRGKRATKKNLEMADEAEQTAAERAASMEAFFATIPFANEADQTAEEITKQAKAGEKRRQRSKVKKEIAQKTPDFERAEEVAFESFSKEPQTNSETGESPEPAMAREFLTIENPERSVREAPTEEQIIQAAAELDESGDFEGVLSKQEKDEVLNFLLEQLSKRKDDGRGFAEFADELMNGGDNRENTIQIPEREDHEPLGTMRDAALALFEGESVEVPEAPTQKWEPQTYVSTQRADFEAAEAEPAASEAHAQAELSEPDEEIRETVGTVVEEMAVAMEPEAVDFSSDTVESGQQEKPSEESKDAFAALLDNVAKQTAELKGSEKGEGRAQRATRTRGRQPEVVQLAFDQQHPESVTERGDTSGKPINLVRLWQKLEQMRNADEEEK